MYAGVLASSYDAQFGKSAIRFMLIYGTLILTLMNAKIASESEKLTTNTYYTILVLLTVFLSMLHFQRSFTMRQLQFSHQKDQLVVYQGGRLTSLLSLVANGAKLCLFEMRTEGSLIGVRNRVFLLVGFNLINVAFAFMPSLSYNSVKGRMWYQLIKINEKIQYPLIILLFIFCSFGLNEPLIESIFKMCFSVIVLTSFRKINASKRINLKFIDKITNLWIVFAILVILLFFSAVKIVSADQKYAILIMYEGLEESKFMYPLILFILSIRYKFYLQVKSIIAHTSYNNFSYWLNSEEVLHTTIKRQVVSPNSHTVGYFIPNMLRILRINYNDIFNKNNSFKKSSPVSAIMKKSQAIRDRMLQVQKERVKEQHQKKLDTVKEKILATQNTQASQAAISQSFMQNKRSLSDIDSPSKFQRQSTNSQSTNPFSSLLQSQLTQTHQQKSIKGEINDEELEDRIIEESINISIDHSISSGKSKNSDESQANDILGTKENSFIAKERTLGIFKRSLVSRIWNNLKLIYMNAFVYTFSNTEIVVRVIVQIASALMIYSKTATIYPAEDKILMRVTSLPIILVFIFWTIFSCKISDLVYLKNFSVIVIIPILFFLEILNSYMFFIGRLQPKRGLDRIENLMISLITLHTLLVFNKLKQSKSRISNGFMVDLDLKVKAYKSKLEQRSRTLFKLRYVFQNSQWALRCMICSGLIVTSLFEATFADAGMALICIHFILKQKVYKKDWLKKILYLDGLILMKTIVSNVPKSGILLNAEFISTLGFYFHKRQFFWSILSSYYMLMLHDDEKKERAHTKKLKAERLKYRIQPWKNISKPIDYINKSSLLVFHCLLAIALINDFKDGLTLILFLVEMATIPLHLWVFMGRKEQDKALMQRTLKFLKPVIYTSTVYSFLRYLQFFQKYSFIQYYCDKYFFALKNQAREIDLNKVNRNGYYFLFWSAKYDPISKGENTTLLPLFKVEILVIILIVWTYLVQRTQMNELSEKESKVVRLGILSAVTNMKGAEKYLKSAVGSIESLRRQKLITKRAFNFVMFTITGQAMIILLTTHALTNNPSIIKAITLSIFMLHIISILSQLRRIFTKHKIVARLESQINYFRANFVEELRVTNKYSFELTKEFEETEMLQSRLYYEKILYDYEQAFEQTDTKFWPFMLLSLIVLNLIALSFHVLWQSINLTQNQRLLRGYSFFGRHLNGDYEFLRTQTVESAAYHRPDQQNIFSYILGYFVLDNSTLKIEMTYIQILISILLLFFGVSSIFYLDKSKRISPVSEKLMDTLTKCIDAKIECYTYRAPKMGISKLPEKCETYLAVFKEFQSLHEQEITSDKKAVDDANLNSISQAPEVKPNTENPFKALLGLGFKKTKKGPESEDILGDKEKKGNFLEDSQPKAKNFPVELSEVKNQTDSDGSIELALDGEEENTDEAEMELIKSEEEVEDVEKEEIGELFPLSERTDLQDKLLYIHINKNKYYVSKLMQSLMFNIIRMCSMWIALNFIYSNSLLSLTIVVGCIYLSKKKCDIFLNLSNSYFLIFCVYFILNWVLFRNKFMEKIPLTSDAGKLRLFLSFVKYDVLKMRREDKANFLLLGCFVAVSLGYASALLLLRFVCTNLFIIRRDLNKKFHLLTLDKYLVIDYKKWKKGKFSTMNIIYKFSHTMLVEIYAAVVFCLSMIDTNNQFFIYILYCTLFVAVSESLKSVRLVTSYENGHQRIMQLSVLFMENLIWVLVVFSYLSNFFKVKHRLIPDYIPINGIMILYVCLSIKDLVYSSTFYGNRTKLKAESSLKTRFSALCSTYQKNDDKIFNRISAFIGKRKLDKMSKYIVLLEDFKRCKIYLDYNQPSIESNLVKIHQSLRAKYLKGFSLLKNKLIFLLQNFLDSNINHYREMDLFALYQVVCDRNSSILKKNLQIDLKFYFNHNFRQFEGVLKDTRFFYEMYRERDEVHIAQYTKQMEEIKFGIDSLRRNKKFKKIELDIYDLNKYAWMIKKDMVTYEKQTDQSESSQQHLREAGAQLLKEVMRESNLGSDEVYFEGLKVELQKRGFILCKFGNLDVVLHNIKTDLIDSSSGYNVIKTKNLVSIVSLFLISNIELVATFVLTIILGLYGGISNILLLGFIFFCILIEEQYGFSHYWKIVYMLTMLKLVLKGTLGESYPAAIQLMLGNPNMIPDILVMVLLNMVLYIQKKCGFSSTHLMKIESPGAAIIRLVVNNQFMELTQRMIDKQQRLLDGLSSYLQKTFKSKMREENYRALKIECTRNIIKAYLEIENYKLEILKMGQILANRMKDDIFRCTKKNIENFFFRNFSILSRKIGRNFEPLIYGNIALLLIYSLWSLSGIETGEFSWKDLTNQDHKFTSHIMILLIIYVIMLILEKFFQSFTTQDLIGIRKEYIITQFWRQELENRKDLLAVKHHNLTDKLRFKVKSMIIAMRMVKMCQQLRKNSVKNNQFVKFIYLIVIWLLVHVDCFFVLPVLKQKEQNIIMYRQEWSKAFLCDAFPRELKSVECYNYLTIFRAKFFYMLNCLMIVVSILQIRSGFRVRIPDRQDYKSMLDRVKSILYYSTPGVREICTFIEYAAEKTTLNIDNWLLCSDIEHLKVNAIVNHNVNNIKPSGKLVSTINRVFLSFCMLTSLTFLILLPIVIFTDASIKNNVYELESGSINMDLYVNNDRKLLNLFNTKLLLENRKLTPLEKERFSIIDGLVKLNMENVRAFSFGGYSQEFLQIESDGKKYIDKKLSELLNQQVTIKIDLNFKVSLTKWILTI